MVMPAASHYIDGLKTILGRGDSMKASTDEWQASHFDALKKSVKATLCRVSLSADSAQ